ncbi:MAG: ribonuclease J [Rickettsiales bacterium]|nr:ribonuclease J [Rickettsiales bacterium]
MSVNLRKYQDKVIFIPLGGAEEIGLNFNLYQYDGKWIIFDLGIGFCNEVPGIDVMVPDISFLSEIKKDILALIVTHAHEDHLGAIQYLWENIQVPIYTSKFTGTFLREKLKEYKLDKTVPIHVKEQKKPFKLGSFTIEFFEISHSVPEMNAAIISTKIGNIVHTGDWKFDNNPVIGKPDDYNFLEQVGKRKILALVGDSTNVFSEGHSGSEGDLQKNLIKLVKEQNNLIVIATFASNLARVLSIIEAAKQTKRKIVVCGRALERIIRIGVELGYIKDMDNFIHRSQIKKHPRNKLLILATGCQGEERAAVRRIAYDIYPQVKLQKNDTVILSSKIIPGNELKIGKVLNQLAKKQVNILTERDQFVHVSGHPHREELKKMYSLIKPKISIPVHGEIMHINEHANFVSKLGVKETIRVKNGSIVILDNNNSQIIGEVPTGYLGVDGNSLIDIESNVFKERKIISQNGIIIIQLNFDKNAKLKESPNIYGPGLFDHQQDQEIISYLSEMIEGKVKSSEKYYTENKDKKVKLKEKALRNDISIYLKKLLYDSLQKNPIIQLIINS